LNALLISSARPGISKNLHASLCLTEYKEAWRFLEIPGRADDINKAFNSVDVDGSGRIDWNEFVFSIMGEAAKNFGPLADLEALIQLLDALGGKLSSSNSLYDEMVETQEERKRRNAELMQRLKGLKGENAKELNSIIGRMMSIAGKDPMAVLTNEQINQYLTEAFNNFDSSADGRIDFNEFSKAWSSLGLSDDKQGLHLKFNKVDRDGSGYIDLDEFITCVKDNRIEELNQRVLLESVGVELDALEEMFGSYQNRYEAFKKSADRRRAMRKQYEANIEKNTKEMIEILSNITGDSEADKRDPKRLAFYQQVRDTFNAFDKDGSGKLDAPEFVQAWLFLGQPGTEIEIMDTFNAIDCDASGHIEQTEFLFAIMGEEANRYGVLADMELLNRLLKQVADQLTQLNGAMKSNADDIELRKMENAKLRDKLKTAKSQLHTEVNDMVKKMMDATGQDFMDMAEIDASLADAFMRFDEDDSNLLDKWEFTQAWSYLGLKGSQEEIAEAFDKVDADKSGKIDLDEFMTAIKSERMAELNLRTVMKKMGVHLDTVEERYNKYKNSVVYRRLKKKEMDAELEAKMKTVIARLSELAGQSEEESTEIVKLSDYYKTLKDTFNAFDEDGSGELGFPEYKEAWKFLKMPNDDALIKASFEGVDYDNSGHVEWSEFVFSIMKEDAAKVGPLADLDKLLRLLDNLDDVLKAGAQALSEAHESIEDRKQNNAALKRKMKAMRGTMNNELNALMNRLDVGGDDDMFSEEKILNALEQAFDKFDRDGNHWLGFTEFAQAWGELGLGRREDEIMRAYYKVDEDKSGSIDLAEFQEAILSEKVEELNVNIMVAKLGHELGLKLGDLHESAAAREARFKSFQMTAQRRRLLKKKMEEDLEKNLFLIVRKLCEMVGEEVPNLEERKVYDAMKQTFNAFDNDGSGQLNFSEFKEAWKFLQKPGSDALIKKSFDNQDVDGSLTVDSNEFAFALMGEEALKYGMLADIELLNKLLERLSGDVSSLASSVEVNKKSQEETARENEAIRMRLERLKRQHNSEMSKMIGEVTKLYSDGASGLEYMSEAQMDKILTDVFNKFDADGSGTMEFPEFKLAWKKELNLGGADMEIQRAFLLVDTDRSGVIELPEFIKAVKSERTPELNMKVIASNMGDSIKSLANYMQKYKEDYANMVSKAKRRRMNRSKFLRHLMERAEELLTKLEEVDNEARVEKDEVGAKLYKQLMETFDAFDKDGSGEMAFAEYQQAWRFLNQPGRQDAVRKAFDSVDVDRSGLVDRDEFVFSIMGQRAEQFGPIADMERLDALIDGLLELIENNRLELLNRAKTQEERDVENERLRARMKNQNEQLTKGMTSVMKAMMDITGDDMDRFMSSNDIDRYLTEAFNKYDKNGNGSLSLREFRQAWEYMNLGGGEEEIRKAFVDVDTDRSGVIEYPEFMRAIKDNRLDELGIGAVLGSIGVQMDDVLEKFKQKKGDFDKMKQTMRRRAKRSKEMIDNIRVMLSIISLDRFARLLMVCFILSKSPFFCLNFSRTSSICTPMLPNTAPIPNSSNLLSLIALINSGYSITPLLSVSTSTNAFRISSSPPPKFMYSHACLNSLSDNEPFPFLSYLLNASVRYRSISLELMNRSISSPVMSIIAFMTLVIPFVNCSFWFFIRALNRSFSTSRSSCVLARFNNSNRLFSINSNNPSINASNRSISAIGPNCSARCPMIENTNSSRSTNPDRSTSTLSNAFRTAS
jgi:Ca2+-binding EF-hand superfamily protein